jgi:hypothetical protein
MEIRKLSLLALAAALSGLPARAAECALVSSRYDDFGRVGIGAPASSVMRDTTRSRECEINRARNYADCEFTDRAGVAYLVSGKEVVRKEIRLNGTATPLPFGLARGDTLLSAARKVASPPNDPDFSLRYVDGHFALGTSQCLKNASGHAFDFYLVFDRDGRLETIGTGMSTEAD